MANGMFDRQLPSIKEELATPEFLRHRQQLGGMAEGLADIAAPFIKETTGYESPKRQMQRMAADTDLSDGKAVQATYNAILAKNPEAANAWLGSVMPILKQNIEQQKLGQTKAPAVYKQKIADIRALDIPNAEKAAMIKDVLAGGGTKIQVGAGETEYSKFAGKAAAERDLSIVQSAKKAMRGLEKIGEVEKILETPENISSGMFADVTHLADRLMASFGDEEAMNRASQTQILEALLGSDVFGMISQLGIGARGLDTIPEREFLIKVMTGEKKNEPEALKKLTALRKEVFEETVKEYNKRLKDKQLDRYQKEYGETLQPFTLGTVKPKTVNWGDL